MTRVGSPDQGIAEKRSQRRHQEGSAACPSAPRLLCQPLDRTQRISESGGNHRPRMGNGVGMSFGKGSRRACARHPGSVPPWLRPGPSISSSSGPVTASFFSHVLDPDRVPYCHGRHEGPELRYRVIGVDLQGSVEKVEGVCVTPLPLGGVSLVLPGAGRPGSGDWRPTCVPPAGESVLFVPSAPYQWQDPN